MFNPFDKPIDSLREEDLQTLIDREVAEGLYVEYKREFPGNDKIGQSVASFANTYGGWYIVGMEADRQTNAAKVLVGIDLAADKDPISKVREIAKSHIDPFPALETKLVQLTMAEACWSLKSRMAKTNRSFLATAESIVDRPTHQTP